MNKFSYLTLSGMFALAMSACSDADVYNPDAVRPEFPLGVGVTAPEGFNWKMTGEVQLSVDVTDLYNARYGYLIEVFPKDPATNPELLPMAAGYANEQQTYETTIVLPNTYKEFYVRQTAPDGTQKVTALPFSATDEGTTYYKFDGAQTKTGTETQGTPAYPIEIDYTGNVTYAFCFEDQWPDYGDFDMNDVVLYVNNIKNRNSGRGIKIEATLEAIGASKNIGLGVQLKALDKNRKYESIRVESEDADEENRTFEAECEHPTILIFNNVHYAINGQNNYKFINTSTVKDEGVTSSHRVINIYIDLEDEKMPEEAYNINNIDFFIIVGTDSEVKRIEVHVPGVPPTALGSTSLFGTGDDDSSVSEGKYYLSNDNLCWAFVVPAAFKWPTERTQITAAYSGFAGWVKSGGTTNTDWYNQAKGNVYK